MTRSVAPWIAALALPLALAAPAMGATMSESRTETVEYERDTTPTRGKPNVTLDVGVNDYARDPNRQINAGVGYGARLDMGSIRGLGAEVFYAGAVNNLDDSVTPDGRLVTNQVGGNLKMKVMGADSALNPYIIGGAAYHRIDTMNFVPSSVVRDNINAFAVPVGAGVEARLGERFVLGGRFTYNFLFNEQEKFNNRNADAWGATVNLGTRIQ